MVGAQRAHDAIITSSLRPNDVASFPYQPRVPQSACLVKNLVILAQICDDSACGQGNVYGQTDGRMDGRRLSALLCVFRWTFQRPTKYTNLFFFFKRRGGGGGGGVLFHNDFFPTGEQPEQLILAYISS